MKTQGNAPRIISRKQVNLLNTAYSLIETMTSDCKGKIRQTLRAKTNGSMAHIVFVV